MENNKLININKVFDKLITLANATKDQELLMFVDKLADSTAFANKVSQIFNSRKLSVVHQHKYQLEHHQDIHLGEFIWFNWNGSSYDVYLNGRLFLENIDARITKKCIKDFNVAVLIKHSRNEIRGKVI